MAGFRFPIAVAVTSLALVATLGVVGALVVGSALAGGPWSGGPWRHWQGNHGFGLGVDLPPELAGLGDLPAGERFAHFMGVQVNLTDKDNRRLTISATPGAATAVSTTSLTIAGNDGSARTFSLGDRTMIRGKHVRGGAEAGQPTLAQGDKVVVVTVNDSTIANAIVVVGPDGVGPWGHRGPFGRS